jgi:hypothetical protein
MRIERAFPEKSSIYKPVPFPVASNRVGETTASKVLFASSNGQVEKKYEPSYESDCHLSSTHKISYGAELIAVLRSQPSAAQRTAPQAD